MIEVLIITAWIIGVILGIMWLFLPWIIVAKLDQVIDEIKEINSKIKVT